MDGERLAELRTEAGLTQAEFGKLFGIGRDTISNYERNKTSPDDKTTVAIAKYFNVSIEYLFGASKDRTPINGTGTIFLYCDNPPQKAKEELISFLGYLKERYNL